MIIGFQDFMECTGEMTTATFLIRRQYECWRSGQNMVGLIGPWKEKGIPLYSDKRPKSPAGQSIERSKLHTQPLPAQHTDKADFHTILLFYTVHVYKKSVNILRFFKIYNLNAQCFPWSPQNRPSVEAWPYALYPRHASLSTLHCLLSTAFWFKCQLRGLCLQ